MNTDNDQLKLKFDEIAEKYDQQRRMLIPSFDDFYGLPAEYAAAVIKNDRPAILDLGAGTGLFSSFLLEKYPQAELTLIDLSSNMLDIAKARFAHMNDVQYILSDYSDYAYGTRYDMIISSLSIHHLEDAAKKAIYGLASELLNEGGLFLNADQVLGESAEIHDYYEAAWREKVLASGLSQDNLDLALERMKLDKYATVGAQLEWLKEAGFDDVDCLYKHYNFAVMTGRKNKPGSR